MKSVNGTSAQRERGNRAARIAGRATLLVSILAAGAWSALVLLFAPVLPDPARVPATLLIVGLAVLSIAGLFVRSLRPTIAAFGILTALAAAAWARLSPSHSGDWPPELARLPHATIDGDLVIISNVRNFDWQATERFLERWEERRYALSSLHRLDLVASYWAGPHIAHLMLSFGFDTGEQLVASIEIRRRRNQEYSALQGAFRNYEQIYILGDERDLLRVRTTFRKEDVYLYRLRTPPEAVQRLFLEYLRTINALAERPAFYNTFLSNCTTQIRVAGMAAGAALPWDWRLLLTGHTPEYLYARGAPDTRLPFEELHRRARINAAADRAGAGSGFANAIREDIPDPLRP